MSRTTHLLEAKPIEFKRANMDVHCTTCKEPWGVYHLRHDAIFETNLSQEEAEAWRGLPFADRLSPRYREMFRAAGYVFGSSVYVVLKCPCCPKGAEIDAAEAEMKAAFASLLGDDEDGLAATLEDFGL